MKLTIDLSECGQSAGSPSGDVDQSCPRINAPSSPPPARNSCLLCICRGGKRKAGIHGARDETRYACKNEKRRSTSSVVFQQCEIIGAETVTRVDFHQVTKAGFYYSLSTIHSHFGLENIFLSPVI
jgi:hypothetical protein